MKERIRIIRKYFGLNQTDFGARVGVKGNTIGNYELGLRNPSEAVIFSICREFNINEEWLRYNVGEMLISLDKEEEIVAWSSKITRSDFDRPFVQRFVHVLSKLDENDWETLEKIVTLMQEEKEDRA